MMRKNLFSFLISTLTLLSFSTANAQLVGKYRDNVTPTYKELIEFYRGLDETYKEAKLIKVGDSDIGEPIYVFVLNKDKYFEKDDFEDKAVILINNGIHPGEPCGVDASLNLAHNWLKKGQLPENVIIAIIPMYNVGGALNRSCCSRANQNGPKEYGFRGNARNLDLNRDFIKTDSKNAQTFTKLFHWLNPDVFIDAHSTNGADYQYVMTLITTQPDKLGGALGKYVRNQMEPTLYAEMDKKGVLMSPYVNVFGRTPEESGIHGFLETPRYSTGYTALFNTIGFTTEAHMWKPYPKRVEATMNIIQVIKTYTDENYQEIKRLRKEAFAKQGLQQEFEINWKLDTTQIEMLDFKGYKASHPTSTVTGQPQLKYHQDQPEEQQVPYYNHFKPTTVVKRPDYYIIPQAWTEVIEKLELNGVKVDTLTKDEEKEVEAYYIKKHNTRNSPYEGHYLHRDVEIEKRNMTLPFRQGDYKISTHQHLSRFIIETLEPHAPDAFFAWNFFDGILQQKEWFSAYVFEEKAKELLANDPKLKAEFEQAKKDLKLKDSWKQLEWIYRHSPYHEPTHNRYPVYRYFVK